MYINCCVRKESRTEKLANAVLEKMKDVIEEVKAQCQSFKLKQESKRKIAADKIHIIFT